MTADMWVKFWGVRGGIPCPDPEFAVYGGNTACVELRCGGRTLVFDAGSGIRPLGRRLVDDGRAGALDLLVSHCHIDHLIGLPFFAPAFRRDTTIRLWTGHRDSDEHLHDAVAQLMTRPLFPITPETFAATLVYRDFQAGDGFDMGDGVALRTASLNHPGGATAYRVDFGGRSFGYFTDHEAAGDAPDPALVALARGLDLLVLDASYTPSEIGGRRGWGHSSWRQAVALAEAAGVGRLALFHHDPSHDDAVMARIEAEAAAARAGTFAARDGQSMSIGGGSPPA
ncbi:MBL fold metallo-hydrolase [Lichenibacterium minor]|uniref:MBL fold metallo-hydrolase n=1 Tax=Lichenibacterium minor TaxID=2316528 RepID=A0A4Q2U3H6_9HYPH|nr:MBL fold metallo-hydrolase [Lichenibacterium minor]RYC30760.1 MBL fold metallo-hydrolase [Lichenibacterium minor]